MLIICSLQEYLRERAGSGDQVATLVLRNDCYEAYVIKEDAPIDETDSADVKKAFLKKWASKVEKWITKYYVSNHNNMPIL